MTIKNQIEIAMIVAMAENRVIGRDNQLPWHLPNDLKYFKSTTMGKPVVMGRKTFESIGRPLPGRSNIVVTANKAFRAEGITVVHSAEEALERAAEIALSKGQKELMVIGGAQLYAEVLSRADRLYLTKVHAKVEGDAFFPLLDNSEWQLVTTEDYEAEGSNPYDYSFIVMRRLVSG